MKAEGVYKGLEVGYEGDLWYEGGGRGNLRLGHKGEEISGKVEGGREVQGSDGRYCWWCDGGRVVVGTRKWRIGRRDGGGR